jgi:hypothetical protein
LRFDGSNHRRLAMMLNDPAARVAQLRVCCTRLIRARDESYQLARQVETSKITLSAVSRNPGSDPEICEQATDSLDSLCESLVRLCALTDQAATNADALASLPPSSFSTGDSAFAELNTAVDALLDATSAAETQLAELKEIVSDTCGAIEDMADDLANNAGNASQQDF